MNAYERVRRRLLIAAGAMLAGPAAVRAQTAAVADFGKLLQELLGTPEVRQGRVTLDIPRLADNGNAVPLKVTVDSPMTAADHVKTVHLIAEKNPRPLIAVFHLGPRCGRAEVNTRIRLNGTQFVMAVATLADGSRWSGIAEVDVTESACYDATNP
jgi:sulfur-oxidizing protein SoxY